MTKVSTESSRESFVVLYRSKSFTQEKNPQNGTRLICPNW